MHECGRWGTHRRLSWRRWEASYVDIRWIRGFLWRKGKIEIEKSANLSPRNKYDDLDGHSEK